MLISDADVVSYNLTSQEIAITENASKQLVGMEDELYSFTGFLIKIDGLADSPEATHKKLFSQNESRIPEERGSKDA